MDENYLRGKARIETFLPDLEESPRLQLLRDLFIEHGAPYCVKALAADLGVSVFSVYKIFNAERPLRASTQDFILAHINGKDKNDTALVDDILGPIGFQAVRKVSPNHDGVIKKIMAQIADLTRREK